MSVLLVAIALLYTVLAEAGMHCHADLVVLACQADRYEEARDVFHERIRRGDTQKISAE